MNVCARLLQGLLDDIHRDLSRPHPHAAERVGFLTCGVADQADGDLILLGESWHAVADENYVIDPTVGACIGADAFRAILQVAWREPCSILHVHRHEHRGQPAFSPIDRDSLIEFVPGFFNACPSHPHGALVLSLDHAAGAIWPPGATVAIPITRFDVIGSPLRSWKSG